ncbi:hypothetical protein [Burkholderia sp. MSMB617WGS]|uniref:hypothetical protein n=1 Tax=Burkholderia sp. MSMB617WGS TaxID=1637831 RepID=UPI000AE27AA7|nr:hypothetical protein [Burkholderia sp. MSMB617WGS]
MSAFVAISRAASPTLRNGLCRRYDDSGKMSIYQLFGAEFAEISTSLRTKSVENPNVENALWIVLSRGRLRRDESARRDAHACACGEPISVAVPQF